MLEDLLALHPLERSWLDEIVDLALGRAEGQVTVGELVQATDPRASHRTGWRRPGRDRATQQL